MPQERKLFLSVPQELCAIPVEASSVKADLEDFPGPVTASEVKAKGISVHHSSAKANLEDLTCPVKASVVKTKAKAKASNIEFGRSQFKLKWAQWRHDFVSSHLARELELVSPRFPFFRLECLACGLPPNCSPHVLMDDLCFFAKSEQEVRSICK
jgi:hypothetical protein